jgi:hypothetical protein
MPSMRELSRWIRDYCGDPKHRQRLMADRFTWHQLCTAMDIIDDVESAIDAYLTNDFPRDIGERYLRVYGILQGLFLQQDALSDLIKTVHPARAIRQNDVLKDIREARNASVGHPTQLKRHGTLSTHGIVQNSMGKEGFDLLSYPDPSGKLFQHVPVRQLIEQQRAETARILTEVIDELRAKEEAHRAQFREAKLVEAFSLASYAFEKIFEGIRRRSISLDQWAVDHLQQTLDDFEKQLQQRGLSIQIYDSIQYLYDEIAHPLAELKKYILRQQSEILSDKSAVVFAEALHGYFDRLREMAGEIDEEYASAPEPITKPVEPDMPIVVTTAIMGK